MSDVRQRIEIDGRKLVRVETSVYGDSRKVFIAVQEGLASNSAHLTRKQARQIQDAISAVLSEENA